MRTKSIPLDEHLKLLRNAAKASFPIINGVGCMIYSLHLLQLNHRFRKRSFTILESCGASDVTVIQAQEIVKLELDP